MAALSPDRLRGYTLESEEARLVEQAKKRIKISTEDPVCQGSAGRALEPAIPGNPKGETQPGEREPGSNGETVSPAGGFRWNRARTGCGQKAEGADVRLTGYACPPTCWLDAMCGHMAWRKMLRCTHLPAGLPDPRFLRVSIIRSRAALP